MSSPISDLQMPIFLFSSQYREGGLYATHPEITAEHLNRFNEFGVSKARVHLITDSSYLKRELSSRIKAIIILGGGYTYFLSRELEGASSTIKERFDQGYLNIWGQCAGGNMLCSKILVPPSRSGTRTFLDLNPLGLLPTIADTSVYPIQQSKVFGELINRRISMLVSSNNDRFANFWFRGSKYIINGETDNSVIPLAFYDDISEKSCSDKPIAAVIKTNRNGSCAIACGAHPEVVKVDIPTESCAEKILGCDKNRMKHLRFIYGKMNIIPEVVSKL